MAALGPIQREIDRTDDSPCVVVVGTTGTGKTVLAQQLSRLFGVPCVEMDALNWEPNWTTAPTDVFRQRVEEATKGDGWVVDGNYSKVRDIVWPRATAVVWLDYPLRMIMWRLLWRTLRRIINKEELWSGNRERFWPQFFSRDSLFLWALQTYGKRRRDYPLLFEQPEYAHLKVVRLHSPREMRDWLSSLAANALTAGCGGSAPGGR